jgi:Tol biopolymer transport system component
VGLAVVAAAGERPPTQETAPAARAELLKEIAASGQKIVAASRHEGRWDLYLFDPEGAEAKNLTGTADSDEGCPRVSFDGKFVAYLALDHARSYEDDRGQVCLLELATGQKTKIDGLDRAESLTWSPDSQELAVGWGAGERNRQGGIRIYSVGKKSVRKIAEDKVGISDIDWSGDGRYFVFGARDSFGLHWQIMTMNADGSNIHQAAFAPSGGFCHAAWSRDNRLAVNSNSKGLVLGAFDSARPLDLRKTPAEGWRTVLDNKVNPHNSNPRWSPDGGYLLWSMPPGRRPTKENINARNLYVVRVADGAHGPVGPAGLVVGTIDYDWIPAPRKPE